MKTRLAMTATLALGLLMSGTGAGLAVSGISGDGSAGIAQYPQEQVLGEKETGDTLAEEQGSQPAEEDSAPAAQPNEQVAAPDDGGLPFTGFLAIPLLLGGVGLLGFGVVLRRGARSEPAH